jgi:hypothetical protein
MFFCFYKDGCILVVSTQHIVVGIRSLVICVRMKVLMVCVCGLPVTL